ITISESSNLDSADIDRMVAEADRNRAADQQLRQEVDARNELDTLAYQVQRRLDELGADAPAHERARAELLVGDARQAVQEQAPLARVRELTSELQQVLQALMARAGGAQGGSSPGDGSAADDDVIDADFDRS
ncbi:MAG TPA: Hsp70 family protein, partial [Pseudonocardiaceae bacterium]